MEEAEKKCLWPGWETVRLIGRGSFGAVYEIRRNVLGEIERAALKVITIPQNPSDIEELYSSGYDEASVTATFQAHLKAIVAEYTLMRRLNGSANVVSCDDVRYVQHEDGIGWDIFIKMELLTPLTRALPEKIPEAQVLKIAKDLCNALVLCRRFNIVPRDIKPQNIFVSESGDYKLGDFGVAKTVEKTMGGTKVGTYRYMAPEVYNNQPYGGGADIYSLGLVLYWLLNERRMPFLPLPPEKLSAGMEEKARLRRFQGEPLPAPAYGSEGLKRIVLRACAYDPRDRYRTAEEMLEDLTALQEGRQPAPHGQMPRFTERKRGERYGQGDETVAEETATATAFDDSTVGVFSGGPAFEEPPKQPDREKHGNSLQILVIAAAALVLCMGILLFGYTHCWFGHVWAQVATCTSPRTCTRCGATSGAAQGHSWQAATCTAPQTCTRCGETNGTALGHSWNAASCTEPQVCTRCGAVSGSALGHSWQAATCTEPQICLRCGETKGSALGHSWQEATTASPKTCTRCGATTGTKLTASLEVGDVISFGHYEQDNYSGTDAISWRVLDVSNGKALLISEYGLDGQPYDADYRQVTWADCTLRTWLNGTFLCSAFSSGERKAILETKVDNGRSQCCGEWSTSGGNNTEDYVFLLSYAEAWTYFSSNRDRTTYPTAYALSGTATQHDPDNHCWWWLRSPGEGPSHAAYVNFDGTVYSNAVGNKYVSVRPCVWIDIAAYQALS